MPTSSTSTADISARGVELASVFQDPLLEEPLPGERFRSRTAAPVGIDRHRTDRVPGVPAVRGLPHWAVVEYDVAGYVAGRPLHSGRRFVVAWTSPWSRRTSTRWPGSPVGHHQVNHSEVVRLRHANRTRAWRCWPTGSAVPSPRSNATCAASVASPRQRRSPPCTPLSTRSSPPRPLWLAPHQHPAALKRPSPELRGQASFGSIGAGTPL